MTVNESMTPAERVRRVLVGEPVDHIPFTAYENKFFFGRAERELRNAGMSVIQRQPNFFIEGVRNCQKSIIRTDQNGTTFETIRVETSKGILERVDIPRAGNQPWNQKQFFQSSDDYGPLREFLADLTYRENFDAMRQKGEEGAGDLFLRGKLGYSPLHTIIYGYMGLERFCFEWADHRQQVLELYEILSEKYLEVARLGAQAPCLAINVCGNVTASVTSPKVFEEYYLPLYNQASDILHQGDKLTGLHLDGITLPYARAISESRVDIIEALSPPPTCDMSVAQAHQLWPDKVLWVNFPSNLHVTSHAEIRRAAKQILEEARPHQRFLLGITEDVPPDRWPDNYRILLEEVKKFGIKKPWRQ